MQSNPGNTPDLIVNSLRNAILQGRYGPNQPLRQDQIAAELGVSKIPLREALVQLKAEGLVNILPKRGAVVSDLSAARAQEIYAMRIALEAVAMERAMPNLTNADLIRAKSVLEIIDAEPDRSQWGELNWEFHAILYQAAEMPMLLDTIHMLHNNVARYLIVYLDELAAAKQSQDEHWSLFESCRAQNIPHAQEILKNHLEQASRRLAAYLA